jgi:WD40 repeat protein
LLLGDRYRLIKHIGQGGFGRTFLAVDEYKPSKPPCVIKQLLPISANITSTESNNSIQKAAQLFHQEAVRLDELGNHPQIPELLAYFTQDSRQYLAQEFINGKNLAQELEADGCFTETQIRQLLHDFLPVLQFVHSRQIIHRDIKPENIIRRALIAETEINQLSSLLPKKVGKSQLVLVDFGAAKFVSGTTLAKIGTVIGTIGYIAPEQAVGKTTFASDIYSLGVTCIHLLTQVNPWDLYDANEGNWVWGQYLDNNPVSDGLGRILDKMLESPTNRRYQLVEEIIKDLNILEKQNFASLQLAPIAPPYHQPSFPQKSSLQTSIASNLPHTPPPQNQAWKCVRNITGHTLCVFSVAFSADGAILASGNHGNTIKLWQLSTGKLLYTLTGHSAPVVSVAFNPHSGIIASGSVDSTIKLWQSETGALIGTFIGHSDSVLSVAFSPDGEFLASGSYDNTIKLWQLSTGKLIRTLRGHLDLVLSVAYAPSASYTNTLNDAILASGSGDNTIKLWQLETGKLIRTLPGHSNGILSVAFSPDGATLASGSYDNTVKLWQSESGALIRTLRGYSKSFNSVAFSPDGEILASGSKDKTIKLWESKSGNLISTLPGHSNGVLSVAFSPDGQTLVSGSQDGSLKIWQRD